MRVMAASEEVERWEALHSKEIALCDRNHR